MKTIDKKLHKQLKVQQQGRPGRIASPANVSGKPNYLYVDFLDGAPPVACWNAAVPPMPGLHVMVKTVNGRRTIVGDRNVYSDDYRYVLMQAHGPNHTWGSFDPTPIHIRQFLPGLVTASNLTITVQPDWIKTPTSWVRYNGGNADISGSVPSSGARYALITISPTGVLTITDGDAVAYALLTYLHIPAKPSGHKLLAAIRLVAGQTKIRDIEPNGDILDLRFVDGSVVDYADLSGRPESDMSDGAIPVVVSGEYTEQPEFRFDPTAKRLEVGSENIETYPDETVATFQGADGDQTNVVLQAFSNGDIADVGGSRPNLLFLLANGIRSAMSAIVSGQIMSVIRSYGWDGANWRGATRIRSQATENWAAGTNSGAKVIISATPSGSTTLVDMLEVRGDGVGIAGNYNIPSGATLPASPVEPQLFMHTPTGRRVLMLYTNGAWTPLYSFGTMTVYVDGTSGTDSANNGYGTGANAWKTLSYAWTQLPSIFYGNITINVAAGTYAETLTAQGKTAGGAFSITIQGTEGAAVVSGTMTSAVQGTGATPGSITDTSKSMTTDAYVGYFIKYGSNIRPISSNTADTFVVDGGFPGTPSGAYTVFNIATILSGTTRSISVTDNQIVTFSKLQISGGTADCTRVFDNAKANFTYCQFANSAARLFALYQKGNSTISYSSFAVTGNYDAVQMLDHAELLLQGCTMYQAGAVNGRGLQIANNCTARLNVGNSIDGFSSGVYCYNGASVSTSASPYNIIRNCTTGVTAFALGGVIGTANNQYSGNTTNENATSASYSYID